MWCLRCLVAESSQFEDTVGFNTSFSAREINPGSVSKSASLTPESLMTASQPYRSGKKCSLFTELLRNGPLSETHEKVASDNKK